MAIRGAEISHSALRVQWADQPKENPVSTSAIEDVDVHVDRDGRGTSVGLLTDIGKADDESPSSMRPSPRKASRMRRRPRALQQTLSLSPVRGRHDQGTGSNSREKRIDWDSCSRDGHNDNGTHGDKHERCRYDFDGESRAADMPAQRATRGQGREHKDDGYDHDNDWDDTHATAPKHASAGVLSPHLSPTKYEERTSRTSSSLTEGSDKEVCCTLVTRRDSCPLSARLTPNTIVDTQPSTKETPGCTRRVRRSPRPLAIFRSKTKNTKNTHKASWSQAHSSTAIHEPRSRCGCRGITVQVNSGPLGISLEAGYRTKEGVILKQTWSDCEIDRAMFRHSVRVQSVHGRHGRVNTHGGIPEEGRSWTSGLIRVRTIGIDTNHSMTTATAASAGIIEPPLPLRPGVLGCPSPQASAARNVFAGVLEVEEGDILVRVDSVQVRVPGME